jgi:PEP-CTERM motif
MSRQDERGVFESRHEAGACLLGCAGGVVMAVALLVVCSDRGYADTINSDTVAVNYKDTKQTLNIPEIKGGAEDKLLITFKKGKGLPKFGYVLLCDGVKTCTPDFKGKDPFKNVSDIVLSGVSKATGDPALIFFSDPLALPDDIVDYLKKNKPLGQLEETGKPQELSQYFGVKKGGGSVSVTSDLNPPAPAPEPSSLALFGSGLLGLAGAARRKWLG